MQHGPEDAARYHAALEIGERIGRQMLRQQYEAFLEAARRREELARMMVAMMGALLLLTSIVIGTAPRSSEAAAVPFLLGMSLHVIALFVVLGGSQVIRWRDGPSLEAIASETRDPTWSDDRLLVSLIHNCPILRRKNEEVLAKMGRQRSLAFFLFIGAVITYLGAGAYVLWSTIHG